ncbi:MAG: hypothetical protein M1136_04290 [Chloroflexi bacterium]|nr:hypothetical protein [Chloroflexota bacterium]MCL5074859.1 hypothetical protein [Chloroflexota bacterium]
MNHLLQSAASEQPAVQLKQFFQRKGYIRVANKERIEALGRRKYKKGYEVRLMLAPSELAQVRHLLEQVGFKAASPYPKGKQIVQPIYGRAAVEWFLSAELAV